MLPRTMDEFTKRYARESADPKGAVRLWLDCLARYVLSMPMRISDAMNPSSGMIRKCLLTPPEGIAPLPRQWAARLRSHPYILWSYAEGAAPENGYHIDRKSLVWRVEQRIETLGDRAAVWLRSSGTREPRRVSLIYREGRWYIERWEELFEPVHPPRPAEEQPEAEQAEPAPSEGGPEASEPPPPPELAE